MTDGSNGQIEMDGTDTAMKVTTGMLLVCRVQKKKAHSRVCFYCVLYRCWVHTHQVFTVCPIEITPYRSHGKKPDSGSEFSYTSTTLRNMHAARKVVLRTPQTLQNVSLKSYTPNNIEMLRMHFL